MDRLNTINQADHDQAATNAAEEQQQQPQAEFEQHLLDAPGGGSTYPHRELYDVTEEDDRLIQAASAAALKRGPPPSSTTISIYDRRLRKLAEELKRSGKSMASLDDDKLLGYASKLLQNDKVIVPALLMISRYRDPDADALPLTTHYRPSREDQRLIREAAEARFGRRIAEGTAGSYASGLRKLAVALRPSSIAKLSDDKLLGHADRLFRNDKTIIAALNALRDYRATIGRGNLGAEGGSSRQVIQPPAPSPIRPVDEQRLGNAADRDDASLPADSFNTLHVSQDVPFDTAEQSGELPVAGFDAPVLFQQMRSATPSPAPSFTQEELFDAADRDGRPGATTFNAPAPWPTMSATAHSPVQSVTQEELFDAVTGRQRMHSAISSPVQSFTQEELFDAADREGLPPATIFNAPSHWLTMSSTAHLPVQSVAQEGLFDATWQPPQNSAPEDHFGRIINQGAAAQSALEQTSLPASESFDASLVVPEAFSHGSQPAPDMMRSKLGRWGLLPDAAQRVKAYDIRGERYTGVLGPGGPNDVQLIHLRSPAVGDTFDVSFAVPKDFSHRTQLAPDMMLSTLGKWDFLPVVEHPVMNYEIGGERYTAMLGPGGPNDVQLIHHPRPALPGEARPGVGRVSPDVEVGLAPGFDALATFEWRGDTPSALAPNRPVPSTAPASSHQPSPQVPELGELFGDDWRHSLQEASPVVIDMLQNLGLLPSQDVPMTRFLIHGQPYTAERLPGGRVLLFHRPPIG
ncbi:hypothetical protein CO675_07890 [Bradyrhizobium sp. C9]|nr:hypothetical protein CO675_07890 [Bradyrhizobium sp. C9]